ncbi:hypothetical protein [Emticicia soli]|uniref:ELWxxDGT repeat-containing protein n=1 Tax=Emticicia soli TaxID=2027878 RepID=A0ABW5JFI6_9BACT
MKKLFTLLLGFLFNFSSAQITFFKELNTTEEGSYPANFTEINGTTFFTVKDVETYKLWKTDGTENGTVQVSDQAVFASSSYENTINLYAFNNELYYFVQDIGFNSPISLWKTDGSVKNSLGDAVKLYFFNNKVYYFGDNKLYEVENGLKTPIKEFISYNGLNMYYRPTIINNHLFFFTLQHHSNSLFPRLSVWKSDGTEAGTSIIKDIDSLTHNISFSYKESLNQVLAVNNDVFFTVKRYTFRQNGTGVDKAIIELWKTNGVETEIVKTFDDTDYSYQTDETSSLVNFNQKLVFILKHSQLWISDGTADGTKRLKTFGHIHDDIYNKKWAFLNNKFYFSAYNNQQAELWESDGTDTGTVLVKALGPTTSFVPSFFATINNRIVFRTNTNELWQSDGTSAGTNFVQTIPTLAQDFGIKPEFIYTSNNTLLFANYDTQHDYELWKSDGSIQNTGLLKNINTSSKSSLISNKKVKVGKIWFFNGSDHRGGELWKTDGTPEGTVIVKDLNPGTAGLTIAEIVALGNTVYFTARFYNQNSLRLFKSDGTENGTVEIPLSNGTQYPVSPYKLVVSTEKLFFIGSGKLWASDGTENGTYPLQATSNYSDLPSTLTAVGNKVFFSLGSLWVSDGTQANTHQVFPSNVDSPLAPICFIEFKNKLYFFAGVQGQFGKQALYESDGTIVGTKIIKEFDESIQLTNSIYLFLQKTPDRLYFRAGHGIGTNLGDYYFNLWTTDGTTQGTYQLKTINFKGFPDISFTNINSQFYIFLEPKSVQSKLDVWTSDGTTQGTYKVSEKTAYSNVVSSAPLYNRLFLSYYDPQNGMELFSVNKTNTDISLISEIRVGVKTSYVQNLMDFDDKILFWANDGVRGTELWQYLPLDCNGNWNISKKSGSWASPDTWTCGRIPTADDVVIIKSEHTVALPPNYNAFAKFLTTQTGATLDIPNSSTLLVKP